MRKILAFVSPELGITYHELYQELAGHMGGAFDEATSRFAPDEAVTALRYYRRQTERRDTASELSRMLGVSPEVVFSACTPDGASLLLEALRSRAAIA